MRLRAHIFISGRVQGVFFRSEIRRKAQRHNVKGWVRNLPDGRVETVLEGEKENVDQLIEFCKKGPPGAKVTKAEIVFELYKGEFEDFRIES